MDEQLSSYENQVKYYTKYIKQHPDYDFAGIYADEGISGTNTKKREQFNKMIADCRDHKIDRIITKSISRFARNTLDCLNYVRELKALGIGITFEKENIDTMDAKGEVLLTILSSLAQDESRSISENSAWGIRKRFEQGKYKISTKRFLGYYYNERGKMVADPVQAESVKAIYEKYLDGKCEDVIAREMHLEKFKNWQNRRKWYATTIASILQNEKYAGDAILQKSYTVDFLTKKRAANDGKFKKYHIKDDHEAIVDRVTWEAAQMERARRIKYMEDHHCISYARNQYGDPFYSKLVCGSCGACYHKVAKENYRWIAKAFWMCRNRKLVDGKYLCDNYRLEYDVAEKVTLLAWNNLLDRRSELMAKWKQMQKTGNALEKYRARQFIEVTTDTTHLEKMDAELIIKVLDYITVYQNGHLVVKFMDGTEYDWCFAGA